MVELADTSDLGSDALRAWRFESSYPHLVFEVVDARPGTALAVLDFFFEEARRRRTSVGSTKNESDERFGWTRPSRLAILGAKRVARLANLGSRLVGGVLRDHSWARALLERGPARRSFGGLRRRLRRADREGKDERVSFRRRQRLGVFLDLF